MCQNGFKHMKTILFDRGLIALGQELPDEFFLKRASLYEFAIIIIPVLHSTTYIDQMSRDKRFILAFSNLTDRVCPRLHRNVWLDV